MTITLDQNLAEKFLTALLCVRESYQVICRERTYCNRLDLECLYRNDNPDKTGQYRCMKLEKQC